MIKEKNYSYLKVAVSAKSDNDKKTLMLLYFAVNNSFFSREAEKQQRLIQENFQIQSNEKIHTWEKAADTEVEKYNFYRLGLATKTIQAGQAEIFFISSILP